MTNAFFKAAASNDVDTLRTMMAKKNYGQSNDKNGNVALNLAAMAGHFEATEYLIANMDTVDIPNEQGQTALLLAAQNGHSDIVHLLLIAQANPNHADMNGHTALILAAINNHSLLTTIAKLLIDHSANIHATNNSNQTPLNIAVNAAVPNEDFIELLLKSGADVNARNPAGSSTILTQALANKACTTTLVRMLLMHKADPNPRAHDEKFVFPMLRHAILSDQSLEVIDLLLEFGADPNAVNQERKSALQAAIARKHSDIAERLVPVTNLHAKCKLHMTNVMYCMYLWPENDALLRLMYDSDKKIIKQKRGKNVLELAVEYQCPGAIKLFAPHFDSNEVTELLSSCCHSKCIEALLEAGGDANKLVDGRVPLFHLSDYTTPDTIKSLWSATKNPSSLRFDDKTLLQWSITEQNYCATQVLLRLSKWQDHFEVHDLFWMPYKRRQSDVDVIHECGWLNKKILTRRQPPYLRIELDYIRLLNRILDEPLWFEKLNDSDSLQQWQETLAIPENTFSLIRQELQLYKSHFTTQSRKFAVPNTAFGTIHSDSAVNSMVISTLARLAKVLESSEAVTTTDQVMEIVDPDMYCVEFGVTKFSQRPHPGVVWPGEFIANFPLFHNEESYYPNSYLVQWLPTPFEYKNGQAKFLSYVNNIPWHYTELYSKLESILSAAMPLIEYAVSARSFRRVKPEQHLSTPSGIAKQVYRHKHNLASEDIIDSSKYAQWKASAADMDAVSIPEFPLKITAKLLQLPFESKSLQDTALPLQVVVQMQSYLALPKTKRKALFQHPGTEWRSGSGLSNEPIVATALVLYDIENVAPIRLELRECFEIKQSHIQSDQEVVKLFDIATPQRLHDRSIQTTGFITLYPGRLVVISSSTQFRLCPLQSLDTTKPGHAKILYYHLISPNTPILSTEFVAPQQSFWFKHVISKALRQLPESIQSQILGYLGYSSMTCTQAKSIAQQAKQRRQKNHEMVLKQWEFSNKRKRTTE